MTITAAADGSALGNPGPAGWAWYIDKDNWASGGWDHGTNNMGELQAVLELFKATAAYPEEELRILCDSQYAINCISKWMPGWKKRGWKKADGKPVSNQDILMELDAAIKGRKFTFEWVKGHAGHDLNEAADDHARAAATAHQQGTSPDSGPGYTAGGASTSASSMETASSEPAVKPEPRDQVQPAQSADVASIIYGLEMAVLDPQVRSNVDELADFLHSGYQEVTRTGGLLDVSSIRSQLETGHGLLPTGPIQVLTAREIDSKMALLAYRMKVSDSQVLVVSSWWQLTDAGWKLRFRQETPEGKAS